MPWHSTERREELLLGLAGCVRVEYGKARARRMTLAAGQALFLPPGTRHRVVNASARPARYVYVVA